MIEEIERKIEEKLSLLHLDLSSATFICFGVGQMPVKFLTPEQKVDLLNHLTEIENFRSSADLWEL